MDKGLVILTDCDGDYPAILKRIWGSRVIHQKCLLHPHKLVVEDFGRNTTLQDEHNKYLTPNILYNRGRELIALLSVA